MADKEDKGKSSPTNDLFWVIIIFVGIAFLWFSAGGPNKTNNKDPFFSGSKLDLKTNNKNDNNDEQKGTTEIADEIKDAEKKLAKIQKEVVKLQEEKNRSVLYGKLNLSIAGADEGFQKEYVRISVSGSLPEKVLISGMSLYSPITGKTAIIGGANPLPRVGEVNMEPLLWAEPGDILYVNTASSPIGVSFRTNLCTGYLAQYQIFRPSMKENCPAGDDEATYLKTSLVFDSACMNELSKINSCEVTNNLSKMGVLCQSFVRANLNYNACLTNHFKDTNFPKREWYVYLRKTEELWKNDDEIIKLVDSEKKTIDSVSY